MNDQTENIEGYEIPLYVALTQRITIAGLPRTYFYFIAIICTAITIGLKVPFVGIPLWFALHIPGVWLTNQDPYFFSVLARSTKLSIFTGRSGILEG